ncbi:hypothetical protein GA840_04110 [Pediococcus ethanolidurans]|uniref:hypothetical protein n=1 Tax=Pediococcus ethanolidurans TaxID=319653 RepID=UPI00295471C1|nr:hypothetical protein [Pediococcus ethanolidurans]MDV7719032.1 hypothetical protein [Pediococcus ethanolidurans]
MDSSTNERKSNFSLLFLTTIFFSVIHAAPSIPVIMPTKLDVDFKDLVTLSLGITITILFSNKDFNDKIFTKKAILKNDLFGFVLCALGYWFLSPTNACLVYHWVSIDSVGQSFSIFVCSLIPYAITLSGMITIFKPFVYWSYKKFDENP